MEKIYERSLELNGQSVEQSIYNVIIATIDNTSMN